MTRFGPRRRPLPAAPPRTVMPVPLGEQEVVSRGSGRARGAASLRGAARPVRIEAAFEESEHRRVLLPVDGRPAITTVSTSFFGFEPRLLEEPGPVSVQPSCGRRPRRASPRAGCRAGRSNGRPPPRRRRPARATGESSAEREAADSDAAAAQRTSAARATGRFAIPALRFSYQKSFLEKSQQENARAARPKSAVEP